MIPLYILYYMYEVTGTMIRILTVLILSLALAGCMTTGDKAKVSGKSAVKSSRTAGAKAVSQQRLVVNAKNVKRIPAEDKGKYSCTHLDDLVVSCNDHTSGSQNMMIAQAEIRQKAAAVNGNAVIIIESVLTGSLAKTSAEILRCTF